MQYPEFLKPGDTIGVTATSDGNQDEVRYSRLHQAICNFNQRGYQIVETPNVRTSYKGRSSDKKQRAKEFMELIQKPEINAIITARGGDFLLEILPYLDFKVIQQNAKWVHGFSDTTGLSFCITTLCDIATSYGENFGEFGMETWHESLNNTLKTLEGKPIIQHSFEQYQNGFYDRETGTEGYVLDEKVQWKNARQEEKIEITARALGGCLDILVSLVGTKYDKVKEFVRKYEKDGILWFLDNCELSSEGVLRALWQLQEAGWFEHAKGFVFGRTMTRRSCYGITFEEAVLEVLGSQKVPVIFEADIGHKPPQFTIVNGAIARVTSSKGKGTWENKM